MAAGTVSVVVGLCTLQISVTLCTIFNGRFLEVVDINGILNEFRESLKGKCMARVRCQELYNVTIQTNLTVGNHIQGEGLFGQGHGHNHFRKQFVLNQGGYNNSY